MTPLIIGRGETRAYFRPAVCLNRRCTQTTTATTTAEIFPSRKLRPRKLAPRTGLQSCPALRSRRYRCKQIKVNVKRDRLHPYLPHRPQTSTPCARPIHRRHTSDRYAAAAAADPTYRYPACPPPHEIFPCLHTVVHTLYIDNTHVWYITKLAREYHKKYNPYGQRCGLYRVIHARAARGVGLFCLVFELTVTSLKTCSM
ncbi:unnamed protein product [Trichogramma brassicae]|uniref:Uncharacterized protein n=1 Tax=Trichogramma brassicae TaxID=86971 RepID=A0A6H5ILI1_9HYME|nr:unnamed protein product [Trichogramma brassicae]